MGHFTYCVRVRYPEVDQMGLVYHGNYIPWLELARSSTIEQFGLTYGEMEASGVLVVVTNLSVDYKMPARYNDNVLVITKLVKLEGIRLSFEYEVRKIVVDLPQGEKLMSSEELTSVLEGSTLLVVAKTEHVCMNRDGKIIRLQRENPELFQSFQKIYEMSQE